MFGKLRASKKAFNRTLKLLGIKRMAKGLAPAIKRASNNMFKSKSKKRYLPKRFF